MLGIVCFVGKGMVINLGEFDGIVMGEFKLCIIEWFVDVGFGSEVVNYKFCDWLFS